MILILPGTECLLRAEIGVKIIKTPMPTCPASAERQAERRSCASRRRSGTGPIQRRFCIIDTLYHGGSESTEMRRSFIRSSSINIKRNTNRSMFGYLFYIYEFILGTLASKGDQTIFKDLILYGGI